MCKDPNFIGLCSYLINIYKLYKSVEISGFSNPVVPNPPKPEYINNSCNPERFSFVKGTIYDPKDESFKLPNGSNVKILENDDVGSFRIIGPTTATTKDLNVNRLNIYYENSSNNSEDPGTVTKLSCG